LTLIYLAILAWCLHQKSRSKKVVALLTAMTVLLSIGVLCVVRASGNVLRIQQEINNWLPDMLTVPTAVRVESSIRWFMDIIINHTGVLLPIVWCLLCIMLWWLHKKILAIVLGSFASMFLLAKTIMLDVELMMLLRKAHFGG